ncbi:hypothetical protein Tco_0806672, partial [Tanacetum coccineum]
MVRFNNDHFAAIMGYGDLQMRNILISRVYYVEGLGHNLFSTGKFFNSDLECWPSHEFTIVIVGGSIAGGLDHVNPLIRLPLECRINKDEAVEQREKRTIMGKGNMKDPVPHDLPPTPFLGHLKEQIGSPYRTRKTICIIKNPEEVHKMKAQDDKGDMDVRLVHDKEKVVREEEQGYDIPLHDDMMQPLTPQTVHIKPPDDDYVALATSPTLD